MQIMSDRLSKVPLFPLTVNVLPGGILPLQIFEPKYIDMVKACMSNEVGFIVALTKQSKSLKENLIIENFSISTYVEIIDFDLLENGLLGISVKGLHRVEILDIEVQEDGLLIADADIVLEENSSVFKKDFKNIWQVLQQISDHPEVKKMGIQIDFGSSSSVVHSLGNLLPLTSIEKQEILDKKSDRERLEFLDELINKFGGVNNSNQDLQA